MNTARSFDLDRAGHQATLPRHLNQQPIRDLSKHLHVVPSEVPSLQRPENGAERAQMRPERVRDNPVEIAERIPSRLDVRLAIKDALFRALPAYRITAAEIADKIGATDATVEGWRSRDGSLPSAEYVTLLRIAFPEFEAELNCALGLSDLDPSKELVLIQVRRHMRSGR